MPEIFNWPDDQVANVVRSSFNRVDRVSRSRSIFSPDAERQDQGPIWRATVTVATPQDGRLRYAFEAFLRRLKGGTNYVRLWDFDYQKIGPIGSGRGRSGVAGAAALDTTWSTGATWAGCAANWTYAAELTAALAIAPGDAQIALRGAVPGELVVGAGDTVQVGGQFAFADGDGVADAAGRLTVALDPSHAITAAAGDVVAVGDLYTVVMELTNPVQAANNETGPDLRARYTLEFVEVPNA